MTKLANFKQRIWEKIAHFDGLAPLALRLYLAPVLMQAGYNKLMHFNETVAWFGDPEWGLGLPFPSVMVALAAGTEFFGSILLLVGYLTRLVCIPMMFTMLVAAFMVHAQHGWLAIADSQSWLANERVAESLVKLEKIKALLQTHGNYSWLTETGSVVILNNGMEFAITYWVMLLALFFSGGGRATSVDYWLERPKT